MVTKYKWKHELFIHVIAETSVYIYPPSTNWKTNFAYLLNFLGKPFSDDNVSLQFPGHILTCCCIRLSNVMPFFKNMEKFINLLNTRNIELLGGLGVLCAFLSKKSALLLSIRRHALKCWNMHWLHMKAIISLLTPRCRKYIEVVLIVQVTIVSAFRK